MNSAVKRLLILAILGAVGAAGVYLARQSYGAPPDQYQNAAPPPSANAKADAPVSQERLNSLPKAGK